MSAARCRRLSIPESAIGVSGSMEFFADLIFSHASCDPSVKALMTRYSVSKATAGRWRRQILAIKRKYTNHFARTTNSHQEQS